MALNEQEDAEDEGHHHHRREHLAEEGIHLRGGGDAVVPAREKRANRDEEGLNPVRLVHGNVAVGGDGGLEALTGEAHLEDGLEERIGAEELPRPRRGGGPDVGDEAEALLLERVDKRDEGAVEVHEEVPTGVEIGEEMGSRQRNASWREG